MGRFRAWLRSIVDWFRPHKPPAPSVRAAQTAPIDPHLTGVPLQPPAVKIARLVPSTDSTQAGLERSEADLLAAGITPPPDLNRQERRAFERARRRHDRFVIPQGPAPAKRKRLERAASIKPDPQPAAEPPHQGGAVDPNDTLIVDEWLEGDNEEVLYEEAELYGEFNFRDSILDQLDLYWVYLRRMQKHDRDAYGLYRQLGATLIPYIASGSMSDKPHEIEKVKDLEAYKQGIRLPDWFRQHWPTFGCVAHGTNPRDEASGSVRDENGYYMMSPKFTYYQRIKKQPWDVQPVHGGKNYILTMWWDSARPMGKHSMKWGRPTEFPVNIADDGSVRILKTRRRTNGSYRKAWDWRIPHEYQRWSELYGVDPQLHLGHIFCDTVHHVEFAGYSMLRVEVYHPKEDLVAVFGLNPRRTPYFFQDRDIVLTENGVKRPIFHMVRPYTRKDGTKVPTQFRGLRDFVWAGYRVKITVPGRDHFLLGEIDIEAVRTESHSEKMLDGEQFGRRLKGYMDSGLGGQ